MQMPDTPLFVKTHDFVLWLLRHTQRFPKNLRHSYTNRVESLAFEFEELLVMANSHRGRERVQYLTRADGCLVSLRVLMRYSYELNLLGAQQIHHMADNFDQIGRLLGASLKGTDR
jgi:hypothetical protein